MNVEPGSNQGRKDDTHVNQPNKKRSFNLKVEIPMYKGVPLHQSIMEVPEIKLEPTPLYLQTLPSVGTGETINNWKSKRMGFNSAYMGIVHTPSDDTIRKVYKFSKDARDNVVPKFKMEIFMQMKAHNIYKQKSIQVEELSNDEVPETNDLHVTVSVPEIRRYGDITYDNSYDKDSDYFYIDMEKIHGQTIQEVVDNDYDLCAQFDIIVGKINVDFQKNSIFHNDLNAGNIIIREINIDNNNITYLDVVVIDFGDAVEKNVGRGEGGVNSTLSICNKSNKRKYSAGKRGTRKRMNKNAHKKSKRVRRKTKHGKNSKKVKKY